MTSSQRNLASQFPTIPQGRIIGSYATYEEARLAIDVLLATEGFSAQSIAVVGSDLRSVERVTGRMNAGRAALSGLMSGVMIGLFVSLMWMIVNPAVSSVLTLVGIFLLAIAFGVIWSLIGYWITPNRREFTSAMQITASRFDLVVPEQLANYAVNILQHGARGGWPQPGQSASHSAGPDTSAGSSGHPGYGMHAGQFQSPGTVQPGAGQGVPAQPGTSETEPGQSGQAGASESQEAPVAPKTYGEMQDELRRLAQQERQAPQQGERQEN